MPSSKGCYRQPWRFLEQWAAIRGYIAYLPLAEGQPVCIHGGSFAGTACDITVALAGQSILCMRLELVWVLGDGGQDVIEHALGVDLALIRPVVAHMLAGFLRFVDVCHIFDAQKR
jgi:hypothetical protein